MYILRPRFDLLYCICILHELTKYRFSDCVEKLDIKYDGGGVEKIRRRRDWSVDDFDAKEIRRGKSTKFDDAGVYCCCYYYYTIPSSR